jgi:hypothetical protein
MVRGVVVFNYKTIIQIKKVKELRSYPIKT